MSTAQIAPESVCYVHCNFCNTVLAVSVPGGNSVMNMVTVRCGCCANLLSVDLRGLSQSSSAPPLQHHLQGNLSSEHGSSSSKSRLPMVYSAQSDQEQTLHIRPPEKRQRVPSAYNRFIKEEIRRIKTNNPDISHREAFSAAAKNWAHLPNIHLRASRLEIGANKKLDDAISGPGQPQKVQGFY